MRRSILLSLLACLGCSNKRPPAPPHPVTTSPTPITPIVPHPTAPAPAAADVPPPPPLPPPPEPNPVLSQLTLAWPDEPLPPAAADSLLGRLGALSDPAVLPATFFSAARRLPPSHLERLYELTPPAARDIVLRGLAGRPRTPSATPPALPTAWWTTPPSLAIATVAGRFNLPTAGVIDLTPLLTASDPDTVVTGARLVTLTALALPPAALLPSLSPYAVTALARPLATRSGAAQNPTPREYWTTLFNTLGPRAHDAPRVWGNAWRAVRDAAPVAADPNLGMALAAVIPTVLSPVGLPEPVTTRWNCENAAAADKIQGMPALTLRCAADPNHPYALAAQAEVLGSAVTQASMRAESLMDLIARAHSSPVALAAIATASTKLPVVAARALIRRLATERDPGVLASLLEGLTDHPDHAQSLTPAARTTLLHTAFTLPEGPSLEARIQAIKLARALHIDPTVITDNTPSSVRAINLALHPDALVPVRATERGGEGVTRVRFDTDAGSFELDLDTTQSPQGVGQLLNAVRAHRYDGLTLHRIVPGFVAQGADPRGDGYGGTDTPTVTELSLARFARGSVGIPLAGLDTGGIQLFVTLADVPHLDGRYPWAGAVRRGMEVIESLLPGDSLRHVEIVPR